MQVRTCKNCPYAPTDLGPHFSPTAKELCCIDCQVAMPVSNRVYPRRRPKAAAFVPEQREISAAVETPAAQQAGAAG